MDERDDKLRRADAVRQRMANRGRRRGFDHRRLTRTLVLGALAVAAAIYWLAVEYDVDMRELVGYFGASVLFVIALASLAIVGALIMRGIRRSK